MVNAFAFLYSVSRFAPWPLEDNTYATSLFNDDYTIRVSVIQRRNEPTRAVSYQLFVSSTWVQNTFGEINDDHPAARLMSVVTEYDTFDALDAAMQTARIPALTPDTVRSFVSGQPDISTEYADLFVRNFSEMIR